MMTGRTRLRLTWRPCVTLLLAVLLVCLGAHVAAQNACSPKTDPKPFEQSIGPQPVSFSYYSDADRGPQGNWCYERTVRNGKSQLWIRWSDTFGEIMNLILPPNSPPQVQYLQHGHGRPIEAVGKISYGKWKAVELGALSPTRQWRSPDEQVIAASPPEPPPSPRFITGFVITPWVSKLNKAISVSIEIRSEVVRFDPAGSIYYELASLKGSTPFMLDHPALRDAFPKDPSPLTLEWELLRDLTAKDKPQNPQLPVKEGGHYLIRIAPVRKFDVRPGTLTLRWNGDEIFRSTVVGHVKVQ